MTQEKLERQIKDWIEKGVFEQIEYFILETILKHHLQEQGNQILSDIEDWEEMEKLFLSHFKGNIKHAHLIIEHLHGLHDTPIASICDFADFGGHFVIDGGENLPKNTLLKKEKMKK